MKNSNSFYRYTTNWRLKKILLTMKLTLICILVFTLQVTASVYSQTKKFDISLKNVSVKEVFRTIEAQSDFRFFYNDELSDVNRLVSIDMQNMKVEDVLSRLFDKSRVTYKVLDNNLIVITPTGLVYQRQNISGTVTDATTKEPLTGVNVTLEGSTVGTITDINGKYSLEVPSNNAVLIFSFIGYNSERIQLTGNTNIDVQLVPDIKKLEEVVVIGYGSRAKKDVTTSISTVNSGSIAKVVAMSPEVAMQGRMTGVQVAGTSGNPMARPTIRIRGVNTWGVSSPLYVIDGVPVTEFGSGIEGQEDARASDVRGPLNIMTLIDPNDIESISVLKDASAAAIYGVRAANGVILITTKKGRGDKPVVEFSTRYGIQNITQKIDVLNTQQYAKHVQDVYASDPTISVDPLNKDVFNPNSDKYLGNGPTYDWQEAMKNKNAPTQDYSLRLSGGTQKSDYFVSLGYTNMKGTLIGSELERYSGSFKLNTQVNKWLKAGLNYRITSADGKDNDFLVTFWQAAQTPPWQPIYDENGPGGYAPTVGGLQPDGAYKSDKLYGTGTRLNLPGLIAMNDAKYKSLRNMGNVYLEVEPLKNLKIKGSVSMDMYTTNRYEFSDFRASVFNYTAGDPRSIGGGNSVGTYGERDVYNNNLVKEITVNYSNSFGNHNIDLLLSGMDQQYNSKYTGMSTEYMTTTLDYLRRLGGENKYTNVGSDINRWALQGLLGRIGYNYNSKYYLDLTVRRDGSARFAPQNRWGTFPSASVAWRISSEPFLQEFTWLDDLKLRAGWGQLGNQEVRDLAYLSPIATNPTFAWGNNPEALGRGYFSSAATVFGLANPNLQWEKTSTTNIGFDAVLIRNLTFSMEYYNKLTTGILQEVSLPNSVGVSQQPVDNIASVSNSGIEISVNYNGSFGDFQYNIGGNITTVKNTVEKTYKDIPLWNIEEGYPLFYVRGYKVGGIFQTQEQLDEWKSIYRDVNYQTAKVAPGDFYFQDVRSGPQKPDEFYSNMPDSVINNYDQVYLGKSIPGFFYGLNINLEYKNFDLGAQFTGVGDVVKYNDLRAAMEYTPGTGNNLSTKIFDSWTPQNTGTNMPRVIGGDPAQNFRRSDHFVESAAYFRLSNIQLGYTLPMSFYTATRNSISNLRVYVGSSNLFTITKYSGFDPESDKYPTPRVFFMGLNVRF